MRAPTARRFVLPVLLSMAAAPAWAGAARVNAPDPADPMAVAIFRLDNGLEVHLTRNPEQPRFYAEIAVRAGSVHDPAESTGLAHYLEHMLFKGTDRMGTLDYAKEQPHIERTVALYEQHFHETDPAKRAEIYAQINAETVAASAFAVPNEIDRLYEEMGGDSVNAHTWHEETVYKVGLPANRLEQWAAIESERFRKPVFRLFVTELETVYEELNRAYDNKDFLLRTAVGEKLFKAHPYGQQTTLGDPEHIKNPSLRNIGAYYERYYVPNNMAVFISGDIDIDATIAAVDRHFSAWQARPLPERQTWAEAPLAGREETVVTYEGEEFLMLAFRTVARDHADAEPLMLMDMILDNATAGLINLNLNQAQRVRSAGSYTQLNNDYGASFLWGVPKDGQTLEDVEKLLLEQIELVKRGEFGDWLIPAIINDFKKNKKAGLEDNTARVSFMRDAWIGHEDWAHAVRQIERIETLTKDDVLRVAKQYFGGDYVAGLRRDAPHQVPNFPKPELAAIEIDPSRQSEFGRAVRAMPADPIEPVFVDPKKDFEKRADGKGRTIYHVHNPINDLFNFNIAVDFGSFQDNTIQTAAMFLDKSGTERLSPEQLQMEWYKLGTSFSIAAGDNETTISLTGLDENFEASIALLLEALRTPMADPEVLERLKGIILVQREDARKQAESIAAALSQFNRYGAESYFLRMLPSEQLEALTPGPLYAAVRQLLDYKHAVTYTGSLPIARVEAILEQHWPVEAELRDPPAYRRLEARRPAANEVYFVEKEGAQASIRIEFPTAGFDESNRTEIDLYNNYFAGGMSGIVFQELREARALAYAAGARYSQGYRPQDEDMMTGGIGSQNDKAPDAVAAFVELIAQLPVSEERFEIAKTALVNQYRTGKIGFRDLIGAVRTWERYGLDIDPRKRRFKELEKASLQDVLDFHARTIAGRPKLISIVGDPAKMDMAKIEAQGALRKLTAADIFVP